MTEDKAKRSPRIGDVYMLQFDGTGSVQSGWRPGVVFQNNIGNAHSPNVVVLPLTTNLKRAGMPTHVLLKSDDTGLARNSLVLCENPQSVSKDRLERYILTLPDHYMKQIAQASIIASCAISYLDLNSVISLWQHAVNMTSVS